MNKYSFTDAKGVKHEFEVNFATLFDVYDYTGFDLLNPASEVDGKSVSNKLLTEPTALIRVVYALCEDAVDPDAFYSAIDAKAYVDAESVFWKAYQDFFVLLGQEWVAIAIKQSLQMKAEQAETNKRKLLGSRRKTFSGLSSSLGVKATGEPKPSGNSPDSPTPESEKKRPTERKSSALSTTPTSQDDETLEARETSTPTKKPSRAKKPKNS